MNSDIAETLAEDPGNPVFVLLAEELRAQGKLSEAQDLCLRGLSHNSSFHKGRLLLARIFFEQNYLPFAVREIELLHQKLPENEPLKKLLFKLAPELGGCDTAQAGVLADQVTASSTALETETKSAQPHPTSATVAEADFDLGDLEMLEEEEKKQ